MLFLRITLFRLIIDQLQGENTLAIQANAEGLHIDAVRMPLEGYDMLLYADCARAPCVHPEEAMTEAERLAEGKRQPNLFEQ